MNPSRIFVIVALCAAAAAMIGTNSYFTFFDDEITIIQEASRAPKDIVLPFALGYGQQRHPPLYDLVLSVWVNSTGGRQWALRVPGIAFYLLGVWLISLTARRLAGERAQHWAVLLGVLWPYGFQFGRIAGWYSFAFLTVALVTHAYVLLRERFSWSRWAFCVFAALALLYTNYLGWVFIGLLALEYWWSHRAQSWRQVAAAGGTLIAIFVLFLPLLTSFFTLLMKDQSAGYLQSQFSLRSTVLFSGFNLYSTYVSESVAPWFWALSVPALLAIGVSVAATGLRAPVAARTFLAGFLLIFVAMSATGLINTKRLLLVAPWLLLALAIAVSAPGAWQRAHVVALACVAAVGWFGIVARDYYAAPRLVEPWAGVGANAASAVQSGAVVVSNSPSFFFYLTYDLDRLAGQRDPVFRGVYPERRTHAQVFAPDQWLRGGRTLAPRLLLVKGVSDPQYWQPSAETERYLDSACALRSVDWQMPDAGAALKERFFPGKGQLGYRIEVREYACQGVAQKQNVAEHRETP